MINPFAKTQKLLNAMYELDWTARAAIVISGVVTTAALTGGAVYLVKHQQSISSTPVQQYAADGTPLEPSNTPGGTTKTGSAPNSDPKKTGDQPKNQTGSTSQGSASPTTKTPIGTTTSPGGSTTQPAPKPQTPSTAANDKFGMSAPVNMWSTRLAQVGADHINYRRIFLVGFDDGLSKVSEAINAGMVPVISWKTGSYSWAQVASGAADSQLHSLVSRLNAIPGKKFLAIHHEPAGDGTAQDYVAMQLRALPILKTANQASVGIIANGWWWSALSHGYSDAEIAQWIPNSLKNICDVIAADTYQDEALKEDGSVKATRLAAWAKRTGGVKALGIGEFNGFTAASITNVMNVVKAEPLFKWALVWNSGPTSLGTPLEGDRLQAFITAKSTPNQT